MVALPVLLLVLTCLHSLLLVTYSACGDAEIDPERSARLGTAVVEFCTDRVLRVFRSKECLGGSVPCTRRVDSLSVETDKQWEPVEFKRQVDPVSGVVSLVTPSIRVCADQEHGGLSFYDLHNNLLSAEHETSLPSPKTRARQSHEPDAVSQSWTLTDTESIYGFGQFVNGLVDYRSSPLYLRQFNTEVAVPFFLSSQGYGIMWDIYGDTVANPPENELEMASSGQALVGTFIPEQDGNYWFWVNVCEAWRFGCSSTQIDLKLDIPSYSYTQERTTRSVPFSCEYSLVNTPNYYSCRASGLRKGVTYRVTLNYDIRDANNATVGGDPMIPRLYYTNIGQHNKTLLKTTYSSFVDYYFIAGIPSSPQASSSHGDGSLDQDLTVLDSVLGGYRELTGAAPLLSKKAYGFWQCKEHYKSQSELLESARKFRDLKIPVDSIVQDWLYWGDAGWGPSWDKSRYPNPKGMIQELWDQMDLQFMVSVWSRFDQKTPFWQQMHDEGYLIPDTNSGYFDAWNPAAGQLFFKFLDDAHFSIGAAAIWLDATEPEHDPQFGKQVFLGPGDELRLSYSLQVSKAVYEGFVENYKEKRPFSLTRSSFTGQQRYAATVWSGDITSSWDSLRRQVAMSINYQLTGNPTWSMDTGGFFRPDDQYTSPEYKLLLTRWFQFAVFTPIMRVHGAGSNTELWNYGQETQERIVRSALNLRYRLLPTIYSGFRKVESHGYTMQRGLVLDFTQDMIARQIADQFMFGFHFMVAPLYSADSSRDVYLPNLHVADAHWTDFHTGELIVAGGVHHVHNMSRETIPVYVRPSILVLGPAVQHALDPKGGKSLEVRIFAGQDSEFLLFEDDGISPDPKRPSTSILFSWKESTRTLTLHKRQGRAFTGMPLSRTVNVVLVRPNHGVGVESCARPDYTATYDGSKSLTFSFAKPEVSPDILKESR